MTKVDVYEKINQIVIEGLQKDGLKWFKPWKDTNGDFQLPMNYVTERSYSGMNIFLLSACAREFSCNEWLTFKQISALGKKLNKGSKSTSVYYFHISYRDTDTGKFYVSLKALQDDGLDPNADNISKVFSLKEYRVFNVDQVEDLEPKRVTPKEDGTEDGLEFTPIQKAENVLNNFKTIPDITFNENSAYYSPSKDIVNMPKQTQFVDPDSYYKTLFHELVHSTGHKSRLNRSSLNEIAHWGDAVYAKEELVAEIGSMYLSTLCELNSKDSDDNSSAYLQGWIKKLKESKKMAVEAMQNATKAVDYILG
jgi:antirestriction protein ArdC